MKFSLQNVGFIMINKFLLQLTLYLQKAGLKL